MKNKITVLAFGAVADAIGSSSAVVEDVRTTNELSNHLEEKFPALKNINYAVAVNKQIVSGVVDLSSGVTVALLPPFSGG